MSIPTGTILKMVSTILWTDGNVMQNVFNSNIVGGAGPYDDEDVIDEGRNWVETMFNNIIGECSDECDGSQVQVYKWDTVGQDWDEVGADPWGWDAQETGEQLPRGVAALLNAKSINPDSSAKKYIGGLTETQVVDGLWTAGVLADLILFGGDWVTPFVGGLTAADWTPGVWSVVDKVLYPFVSTVILPTIPAYQRRRKRGVGI